MLDNAGIRQGIMGALYEQEKRAKEYTVIPWIVLVVRNMQWLMKRSPFFDGVS